MSNKVRERTDLYALYAYCKPTLSAYYLL